MNEIQIFIDGSVNTKTKVGYGAILLVRDKDKTVSDLQSQVKLKRFEHTSSTKLEIQTMLWAIGELGTDKYNIMLFTDSQNTLSLPRRRERFEKNNYLTKGGKTINNHILYKEFFSLIDYHKIQFIKIKGHQLSKQKTEIDKIFTLVDRASRKALRNELL